MVLVRDEEINLVDERVMIGQELLHKGKELRELAEESFPKPILLLRAFIEMKRVLF